MCVATCILRVCSLNLTLKLAIYHYLLRLAPLLSALMIGYHSLERLGYMCILCVCVCVVGICFLCSESGHKCEKSAILNGIFGNYGVPTSSVSDTSPCRRLSVAFTTIGNMRISSDVKYPRYQGDGDYSDDNTGIEMKKEKKRVARICGSACFISQHTTVLSVS